MIETLDAKLETDECRWAALMSSAQSGNEIDYQQLLTELSTAINHYLCSRIGRHHFVEDCVQDTLIAIHEARHTYDSQRLFRPWMFAIVRHKAIDALRRNKSYHNALEHKADLEQSNFEARRTHSMEQSLDQGRMMKSLSPQYREVIILTKIVGLSISETASRLNISQSAVKVRVHRAIGHLRRLLEAEPL